MLKKGFITLSTVTALALNSYGAEDVEAKLEAMEAKIKKLEKQIKKTKEKISEVKILANNDNIKFDVDFRTAIDNINYKHTDGSTSSNSDLLTNRLWLGMGYAPSDNVLFKGKLSYYKTYGENTQTSNYEDFDWITNENTSDDSVSVKEAYWLYKNDTFLGTNVPWTISVGRRPSTDGLGINLREGMKENSPLSHTVNVEFDGLSSRFDLDQVTGVEGMWWKLCTGRGLTNANSIFDDTGDDAYAEDEDGLDNIDMYGFIFVPWDNGQYSVWSNYAKAVNLIGYDSSTLSTVGDMELLTAMFKAEGLGDGINDFLDDTIFFASWAMSKTDPNSKGMLGSTQSETGTSTWLGLNMPCPLTENGRIGVEWNKGSKYWRSMTYGEDTMTGSKIAARGTAWEVYYTKPLTKALYFNARYTKVDYDYTGSQAFFGDNGAPSSVDDVDSAIKESTDIHASISYRY